MVYYARIGFRGPGAFIAPGTLLNPDEVPHFKRYVSDYKIIGFEPGTPMEDHWKTYFRNKYQIELQEAPKAPEAPEMKTPKPEKKVVKPAQATKTATGLTGAKATTKTVVSKTVTAKTPTKAVAK